MSSRRNDRVKVRVWATKERLSQMSRAGVTAGYETICKATESAGARSWTRRC